MNKIKKIYNVITVLVLTVVMISCNCLTALAADKNIKISLFNQLTTVKTTSSYSGSKDTPEGFCVNGTTAYSTKIHNDGTTSIIKTINLTGKPSNIMPAKNLSLGHANDLTYYNGYIYAAGLNNKFYRIKDNGKDSKGLEKYSVKTYSVSGASLSSSPSKYASGSWNITHFTGKYFIFCSSINSSLKLTFRIGYFDDNTNKFVVTKTFYGKAKAFTTIQGISYHNGYLYQTTSDNAGSGYMNKISEFNIGKTYKDVSNGKTYSLAYYGTFDDNKTKSKFEIESLDFDSRGYLYVLMNVSGKNDPLYVSKTVL